MPIPRYRAVAAGAIAAAVTLTGPTALAQTAHRHAAVADCSTISVPMRLPSGDAATVGGELCRPRKSPNGTVQVLLSGLTYDYHYWTMSPGPDEQSYVTSQNARGFTTLTLDRLGTGRSSRPPAGAVTFDSDVDAVHEVVSKLHAGLGGTFSRIILVGHSYGAGEALGEAARYNDVTAIVLSGFAHSAGPRSGDILPSMVPAESDPVLRRTDPPDGYLTTAPGSRSYLFYDTADASSAVIAADEATKSTMTTGERDTLAAPYDGTLAAQVTVPVLIGLGDKDALVCGGPFLACSSADEVRTYEKWIFTGGNRLDAYLLPGAGHSMNLHRNAAQWYAEVADWVNSVQG